MHSCKEDGLVVMDNAQLRMQACHVHACLGPGIDISDNASCELVDSVLNDNVGKHLCFDGIISIKPSIVKEGAECNQQEACGCGMAPGQARLRPHCMAADHSLCLLTAMARRTSRSVSICQGAA